MSTRSEFIAELDERVGERLPCGFGFDATPDDLPQINQWLGQRMLVDSLIAHLEPEDKRQVVAKRADRILESLRED